MEKIASEFNHLEHLNYLKFSHFIFSFHNTAVRGNYCQKPLITLENKISPISSQKSYSDGTKCFILLTGFTARYHRLFHCIYFNKLIAFSVIL